MAEQAPDIKTPKEELQEIKQEMRKIGDKIAEIKPLADTIKASVDIEKMREAYQVISAIARNNLGQLLENIELEYDPLIDKLRVKILGEEIALVKELNTETLRQLVNRKKAKILDIAMSIIAANYRKVAERIIDLIEAYDWCREETEDLWRKINELEEECSCGD